MSEDKSIVEYISEVDELLEISNFLEDDKVDEALGTIVKIIHKPDIPGKVLAHVMVQLQAISSVCAMRASYYKNLSGARAGTEGAKKKNLFYSLHEAINELVAALKYLVKA